MIAYPMIFYYYLGQFRIVAVLSYAASVAVYFYSLYLRGRRIKQLDSIALILAFQLVVGLITFGDFSSHLLSFRLIFGFGVLLIAGPYLRNIDLEKIFVFLACLTIVEKISILTFPSLVQALPNYDTTFYETNSISLLGGVHSFGGNRTVSGVILLSGFIYLNSTQALVWKRLLTLFASFLCASGTALIIAAIYLIYMMVSKFLRGSFSVKLLMLFPLILLFYQLSSLFFVMSYEEAMFDRFSLFYVDYIFKYKLFQIKDFLDAGDISDYFLGMGVNAFTTESDEVFNYGSRYGDFIALDFLSRYGILGALIFLSLLVLALRGGVIVPILIIVLGTMHYHVLFSSPGQIITALLIINGRRDFRSYQ